MLSMLLISLIFVSINGIAPHVINQDDIATLKYSVKYLAVQLEKWNNLFLSNLEPRIATSASNLASIEIKINNLLERAHIWDTFQLHVSAWNEQLSSIDRKIDIVSSTQDKLMNLDAKLNTFTPIDYKLEEILKRMEKFEEFLIKLNKAEDNFNHNALIGEFTLRGVLSTVKMIEKKFDTFSLKQSTTNSIINKNKLNISENSFECSNNTLIIEDLIKDMSPKIDVIYDRITGGDIENDFMEGSGNDEGSGFLYNDDIVTNTETNSFV